MTYDSEFFDYVDQGAIHAAQVVVRELASHHQPGSLLDVGCGRGGWAHVWKRHGCHDVAGIDGDYVDRARLYIEPGEFAVIDLSRPFDLSRRFDLVQCLEVAEHLPAESAAGLVTSVARHGDIVLFSAATPGQGGTHHVNEQPLEYWRDLFAGIGYVAFDFLRPRIQRDTTVEPWYRFNTIIYANPAGQARLPAAILDSRVASGAPLHEFGPWSWRLRKAVVRRLPLAAVDRLALINSRLNRLRRRSG